MRISVSTVISAATLVWFGAVASAGDAYADARGPSDAEARAFVEAFFRAFDARDLGALEAAFAPGASIVHDDGVETSVPKLLEILRNTKEWPPRERTLSRFTLTRAAGAVVVGCLNHVRFAPPGRPPTEFTYNETWVLVPAADGLRAVRSHYSLVTREEHSEDVP